MNETLSFQFPDLTPEEAARAPAAFLTTLAAGKMRFRWDETNPLRDAYFARVLPEGKTLVPLELIHSRTVFCVESGAVSAAESEDVTPVLSLPDGSRVKAEGAQGDGLVSAVRAFVPVITVADCMPLWLYDPVTGVFGVLHSGWKGTGIAGEAVRFAQKRFDARPEDIRFVIGPHIEPCCYRVDNERADYFIREFGEACVSDRTEEGSRLSLTEANKAVLAREGVLPEHILITGGCTSCFEENGAYPYASFRRQGPEKFAPMAAYIV
ncbi:MAG: polyphenol oxidase family protein [Treponema sp.]|nr:polyphenol oxidase family protein [Candidatus Treponema caballi]